MKINFYLALFFLLPCLLRAQETLDWSAYMLLIQKADTLYMQGQFAESARAYSNAFIFNNQNFSEGNRYHASRAWAKTGQIDSAIHNLRLEIKTGFYHLRKLKNEPAFQSVKTHPEWKEIVQQVKRNEEKENKRLGKLKGVKERLEGIHVLDQEYRKEYLAKQAANSFVPGEKQSLMKKIERTDKANAKYVKKILDKYGWLDHHVVGFEAGSALFLVVQHADLKTQEKYLPLLRKAVKEKKALGHHLALLEDRVLVGKGDKQIYGSQVQCDSAGKNCWIFPIDDEKNVDKRRADVGLPPLADYVKYWNIVYRRPE